MIRPSAFAFAGITALACVALVFLQLQDQPGAAAAKMLASAGFVATALCSGAWRSRFGRWLLAGLLLSWLGDAFLVGRSRPLFLAGLGSFLLAHVAYTTAFFVHGTDRRWLAFASIPLLAIATGVMVWLGPLLPPELNVPVHAYVIVITLMVISAFGARGAGATILVPLGAVLFFVSDLSVAAMRLAGSDVPMYAWGLPAYYAGQLCLALSCAAGNQAGPHSRQLASQ